MHGIEDAHSTVFPWDYRTQLKPRSALCRRPRQWRRPRFARALTQQEILLPSNEYVRFLLELLPKPLRSRISHWSRRGGAFGAQTFLLYAAKTVYLDLTESQSKHDHTE